MERDIKRAKGADELPIATMKETVIRESTIEHWEAEIAARDATIDRLTKENEELQMKLKNLSKVPTKKGAQTRYWRKEEHERFLEALEKFGQRDVKNISVYVGTRSPTQVRTHAQKYFLKQKREESAQQKSLNQQARKRRATEAAEEDEEEDGEEEDMEDDMDDGEGFDGSDNGEAREEEDMKFRKTRGVSGVATTASASAGPALNAANSATTIKLKTQDVIAHAHGTRAASKRGSAKATTGTTTSANSSAGARSGSSASPAASSAAVRSPTNTTTASSAAATSAFASPGYNPPPRAGKSLGPTTLPGTSSAALTGSPSLSSAPLPASSSYLHSYGTVPGASAAATAAYGSTPGFPNAVFYSADEMAVFWKAVKTYERETDRAKVLTLIREYFLPYRSLEDISNMVDYAFPVDPHQYNNQQIHAAMAYAQAQAQAQVQRNLYYPDASTSPHVMPGGSFLAPQLARGGTPAAPGTNLPQQGLSAASNLSGLAIKAEHASTGFNAHEQVDFAAGSVQVDSAALNSLSEQLSGTKSVKTEGRQDSAVASNGGTQTGSTGAKPKDEDDDLDSELATLTDHRGQATGSSLGGLLGRPVALSPMVFGSTTPLGFPTGMTPLMTTPLPGFMSPIINFAAQSPLSHASFYTNK